MEQPINYRAEILADLAFIPAEDMEAIYKIIHLIAKPHREKAEEDTKPNKEIMQAYADKFRKGYSIFMNKEVGLNFSYQVQEKFTILKISFPDLEEQQMEVKEEEFDLDKLCENNQVKIIYNEEKQKYELEYLEEIEEDIEDKHSEKMLVFTEGVEVCFIESSDKSKWQTEKASDDARNLFELMLKVGDKYQKTKLDENTLEKYTDAFKKTFRHLMKNNLGINFTYEIQEDKTILQIEFPKKEEEREKLRNIVFDLEAICAENKVEIVAKENRKGYSVLNLAEESPVKDENSEKAVIFNYAKNSIYLIDGIDRETWQVTQAQTDARNLLGFLFLHIKNQDKIAV